MVDRERFTREVEAVYERMVNEGTVA
jgi:hypothetical protein